MLKDLWYVMTGKLSTADYCDLYDKWMAAKADATSQRILAQTAVQERNALMDTIVGDEMSPMRKALSDRIGEAVIERMKAEDKARRHTTGEL